MSEPTPPTPVLVAFLVCDTVIQDSSSGKKTLVGVFSNIMAAQFPASHSSPWLFVKLMECEGTYDVKIQYARVATQEVLLEVTANLESTDRHEDTEIIVQLPTLNIPDAGQYEFRLWLNNHFIGNVRMNVHAQAAT